MNYKRGKAKEKKDDGSWTTPKEYQKQSSSAVSLPLVKRKYKCKKLKGDHEFIRTGTERFTWKPISQNMVTVLEYFSCRGCMKQKIERSKEPLDKELDKDIARLV